MSKVTRVLIVDDDAEFRQDCRMLLEDDFEIQEADDDTFRDVVEKQPFDLVLLDIMMPNKNGDEVLLEIRGIDRRCAVVVVTNDPHHELASFFKAHGVDIVQKGTAEFVDTVRKAAERYTFKDAAELSVLVVDDEPEHQGDFRQVLESTGITEKNIEYAGSVEDAALLTKNRRFDIYIIDMCYRNAKGQQEVRGHEVVLRLLDEEDVVLRSVVLPLTTKSEGEKYFKDVRLNEVMKPFFYDEEGKGKSEFGHVIKEITERGPFRSPL